MDAAAEGLTGLLMLSLLDSGCLRNMYGGVYGRRHLGDGLPVRQRFSDSAGNRVYVELDDISPAVRVKRKKLSRACCLWVYNLRLKRLHLFTSIKFHCRDVIAADHLLSCFVTPETEHSPHPDYPRQARTMRTKVQTAHPTSPSAGPFTSIRHDAASRYSSCPPQRRFIAPTRTRIRMDNKRLTSFSSRLRSMYTNISGLGPLFPLST